MPEEINIVFSSHRVEFLNSMITLMEKSDVIILEEAPSETFRKMLKNEISIEEYLKEELFEFPEFSYRFYKILSELYRNGKEILQVEPYMERLFKIYELFSEGKNPQDVKKMPELKEVYEIEKKATKELIDFYEASISKSFEEVVEIIRRFADADAQRFRLRDSLRADAIVNMLPYRGNVFIEAGAIHQYLGKVLSKKLANVYRINKFFALEDKVRELTGKKWIFPPGDILTLRYIFNKKSNTEVENLLCARALVYIILIEKEEMIPNEYEQTPHLLNEIKVIKLVNKLSYDDCKSLYSKIRFKSKEEIREIFNKLNFELNLY